MSDCSSSIIRATAKYNEASEPNKLKPIIRIDGSRTTHYIDSVDLADTVRASIDSGRDNPFKPDGEIYRSADPIVDYYKFGPNQSRAHSPTYEQLMANGKSGHHSDAPTLVSSKQARRDEKKRRKLQRQLILDSGTSLESAREPCDLTRRPYWKRLLCCCCGHLRCCNRNRATIVELRSDNDRPKAVPADRSWAPENTNDKRATNLQIGATAASRALGKLDSAKLPTLVAPIATTTTTTITTTTMESQPEISHTSTQSTKVSTSRCSSSSSNNNNNHENCAQDSKFVGNPGLSNEPETTTKVTSQTVAYCVANGGCCPDEVREERPSKTPSLNNEIVVPEHRHR